MPVTFGSQINDIPAHLASDMQKLHDALNRHYGVGWSLDRQDANAERRAKYVVTVPDAATGPKNLVKTLQEEKILSEE
ncbi:hypothetical protein FBEOM_4492 [Fusarium beomiforme]|uniref:Uncharacterized protein n=1 Tax=Fusarium beomiforme TaxID=44412 RepID=A0A9P5DZW3_9HYPO|nr:hypothetical protein FBEOM_4492 [Fusarium beomiforme]